VDKPAVFPVSAKSSAEGLWPPQADAKPRLRVYALSLLRRSSFGYEGRERFDLQARRRASLFEQPADFLGVINSHVEERQTWKF